MKIHFNKFERTAGLFVIIAFGTFFFFSAVVAIKQGWFRSRYHYLTKFSHGEGLHPGTLVQISGLRAGSVESVALNDDNRIEVSLSISYEFRSRIKHDSLARVIRPFVIGDKVVEVTLGAKDESVLKDGSEIRSEETLDLMDMLGGGKLGPYLQTLDGLLKNLQVVVEAFTDPKRSKALIGMFDELLPTMVDIREVSREMTHNKNLGTSMQNLSYLTTDMKEMLPQMVEFSKHLPELGETSAKTMAQLTVLTSELNKILPAIATVAPQLPEASRKSIEALKEAVVVLRAMQKSFLLRGAVRDVKEEDEKNQIEKVQAEKAQIEKEKVETEKLKAQKNEIEKIGAEKLETEKNKKGIDSDTEVQSENQKGEEKRENREPAKFK